MSQAVSRDYDVDALDEGERACYLHILQATGLQDGQNVFFNANPPGLNMVGIFFGGKAHADSPPGGVLEKVSIRLRYVSRTDLKPLISKILNCLPMENDGRVWYFGPRLKYCPDSPEIVPVPFEANGQKVSGYSADIELVAGISLIPIPKDGQ